MECIISSSTPILVNGSRTYETMIGKSLRQGDHLSLFLFQINMEGMHVLFKASIDVGLYKGYRVGKNVLVGGTLLMRKERM